VTGSSRGLGRQIAEQALAAGHRVVATARNPRDLDDLAARYGDSVHVEQLDVTDPAAAQRAVENGAAAFGRLDVVVNNVGQGDRVSLEDTTVEVFRRQVETNFLGTVYVTKAAVPILREQGGGRIIQVSSPGSSSPSPSSTTRRCGCSSAAMPTSTAARRGGTASRPTRNRRPSAGPLTTTRPQAPGSCSEAAVSPACAPDRRARSSRSRPTRVRSMTGP
jgi:NAD(P)-dependent dehydrogenase (short-subunit alcohol dehydrogenase family)